MRVTSVFGYQHNRVSSCYAWNEFALVHETCPDMKNFTRYRSNVILRFIVSKGPHRNIVTTQVFTRVRVEVRIALLKMAAVQAPER